MLLLCCNVRSVKLCIDVGEKPVTRWKTKHLVYSPLGRHFDAFNPIELSLLFQEL